MRHAPPGFGGIERMAHNIASIFYGTVYFLYPSSVQSDLLHADYQRAYLPSLRLGRFALPFPGKHLSFVLLDDSPLIAHLPCPTILFLVILARLLRPRRTIFLYWHAFIEPPNGLSGLIQFLYQELALFVSNFFKVVATSPVTASVLRASLGPLAHVPVLPCCLSKYEEEQLLAIRRNRLIPYRCSTLIAIGRLDSYKRIDWLLEAVALTPSVRCVHVVGDGPKRSLFEKYATSILLPHQCAIFHGLLDESGKHQLLAQSDLLVLPSDRCNEAFGIVQLEAMASGIPSLSFDCPRSGMYWVSCLSLGFWNGSRGQLPLALSSLFNRPSLYREACKLSACRYDDQFSASVWRSRCLAIFSVNV